MKRRVDEGGSCMWLLRMLAFGKFGGQSVIRAAVWKGSSMKGYP
jgi:hypothetical protein